MCTHTKNQIVSVHFIIGDPSKPKAWSRYAPDSSAYKKECGECKDKGFQEKKGKSGKESKKDSEVQELIDKVLWVN
jgi:multiple RNA-binding domain-containing protein 1